MDYSSDSEDFGFDWEEYNLSLRPRRNIDGGGNRSNNQENQENQDVPDAADAPDTPSASETRDKDTYQGMLGLLYLQHQHTHNLDALEGRVGVFLDKEKSDNYQPGDIGDGVTIFQLLRHLLARTADSGIKLCDAPCSNCVGVNRHKLIQHIRRNLRYGSCARRVLEVLLALFATHLEDTENTCKPLYPRHSDKNCFEFKSFACYHPYRISYALSQDVKMMLDEAPDLRGGFVYV